MKRKLEGVSAWLKRKRHGNKERPSYPFTKFEENFTTQFKHSDVERKPAGPESLINNQVDAHGATELYGVDTKAWCQTASM